MIFLIIISIQLYIILCIVTFKYIKKYKHILLGYKYDNIGRMKYIVFAIPGKRSIIEQPFEGKSGFVTWVPLKLGEEREESLGYWLMFYDFRNRTIAIPIKSINFSIQFKLA